MMEWREWYTAALTHNNYIISYIIIMLAVSPFLSIPIQWSLGQDVFIYALSR